MQEERRIEFSIHPDLLSKQLGSDLYRAGEALRQLVANSLDSGASRVDVGIHFNELDEPHRVVIMDNGCGIAPSEMSQAFGDVGVHMARSRTARETIGSRGVGRFAVFCLAAQARWETVADSGAGLVRQTWTMEPGCRFIDVHDEPVSGVSTSTVVDMTLSHRQDIQQLFSSVQRVRRTLFNSFAAYLARYEDEVSIWVNDERVDLQDFVDERETEEISSHDAVPDARLHHMVLGQQVYQAAPSVLVFATHGATVSEEVLEDEAIPGRKYLGLVDSPYLSDLTNTSKSQLAAFDSGFRALKEEASDRARGFIRKRQGDRAKDFLEWARSQPHYPYKETARTPVEHYRRQLYDGVLLAVEEQYHIRRATASQQQLMFALTRQLLQSENLASVLTSVLGLKGEEVDRFASLLRRTSLSSVIAVANLLVDRLSFLNELEVLVYGSPARWVKERSQLHRIIEGHSWIFGEQFHLMASDQTMHRLLLDVATATSDEDSESLIEVDPSLKDIPDLYLTSTKWNEGAKYHQHLVVELKRPSVRIAPRHVQQLQRYAVKIVENPVWSQRANSHRFTFVLVSSEISDAVIKTYQENEEPGLLSRPKLQHPSELWALRWSDYLDRRREELKFLEAEIEITADPELLEYLRSRVGEYLPEEIDGLETESAG
jgi:hypothetical protein